MSKDIENYKAVLQESLNLVNLRSIVQFYGKFPDRYRLKIWQLLLQIPKNQAVFKTLLSQGHHKVFLLLDQQYPVPSGVLRRAFHRTLSLLANWSPLLAEVTFLPYLVFPFVKLFHSNLLVCFEVVATFLCNWCENWCCFLPYPPINVLNVAENVLAYHDRDLLLHYVKHGITGEVYIWPLLYTVFSEIVEKDQWLQLWDHIFSNPPCFMLYLSVALNIVARKRLIVLTHSDQIKQNTPLDLTPESIIPTEFLPLLKGNYSRIFNPKRSLSIQQMSRDTILPTGYSIQL
ncbi:TBC1 domain family member 31-like isoform X2 [Limulus polyphemus]|uniref:TBC1 domain family member 31-like isoform X2 n=1 Tax=Limulus polyphemus TaxID=6850 RepID=A0ABM1TJ04_LIMPO|nr:TBC1 domain family member 31-like isoform X2 [Limulus polyphemus]